MADAAKEIAKQAKETTNAEALLKKLLEFEPAANNSAVSAGYFVIASPTRTQWYTKKATLRRARKR